MSEFGIMFAHFPFIAENDFLFSPDKLFLVSAVKLHLMHDQVST